MSVRCATEKDIPAMLAIYSPYVENTTYTFEYDAPCLSSFTQRFYEITAQFPWLVWEEEGAVLGYAYATAPFTRAAYRWVAEPSIYLMPEARGRQIGKALYTRLEEILARQGYRTLYVIITGENKGSLAFHEKMGYRHLAEFPDCGFKHGRWLAVNWMEKRLAEPGIPERFPQKWTQCI